MKKILTLLAIGIVGLTSCQKENTEESQLYLDPSVLIYDADGGEQGVYVTSSGNWQLSGNANWCKPSATSGRNGDYVYFTVDASQDTDEKTATYAFRCGTASKELTVIQKQKDALTITSSTFEIPAEGKEISIEVKANIDFDYEITFGQDWIHKIETKSLETTILNFIVDENPEFKDRDGEISITSGEITEKITIHQAEAKPTISIGTINYNVPIEGATISIEIDANVDYYYDIPQNAYWIEFSKETENGIEFIVDKNNLIESREATIEFYNTEYNLSSTVTIKQDAYSLDDMLQTVHVASKGTLSKVLAENGIENAEYLKITGELNDVDFLTLNEMGKDNLVYIDISEIDMSVLQNNAMSSTNISYIILPEKLVEIGASAFSGCQKLQKIIIPETVEIIGSSAFSSCIALTAVNLPTSLKEIGSFAFSYCSSLQCNIIIPSSIEILGESIFSNSTIPSVTFSAGDTPISVTRNMFSGCKNLTTVDFETVCPIEEFETSCFEGCTALSEITVPAAVTKINSDAFADCTSLRHVAFEKESNLTTIYGGVSSLGPAFGAFKGCTALSSISIPASVETIYGGAFYGCTSLKEVRFDTGSKLSAIKSAAEWNHVWRSAGAFENCTALISITIPKEVESIGGAAFRGCSSLTEVNFEQGSKLQSIQRHKHSARYAPFGAFDGCPLKIFDASNCTELVAVTNAFEGRNISLFKLGTITPPTFINSIGTSSNAILKVPDESIDAYKNSSWAYYFSNISGLSE